MRKALHLASLLLAALALGGGLAHLYAYPNKIGLSAESYLAAQQAYRGWALLGIPLLGALLAAAALTLTLRGRPRALALLATALLLLQLAVFFLFTWPTNQATGNWTFLPPGWEELRRRWELSHAVSAVLQLLAFLALAVAALDASDPRPSPAPPSDARRPVR